MKVLVTLQSLELDGQLAATLGRMNAPENSPVRQLWDMHNNPVQQPNAVLFGEPEEEMEPGMVMISVGPLNLEFDAYELSRALKPFIRRRGQ